MRPEGWALVAIIVIALVLFGAPKLPGLARSVGQSLRIFKSEVKQMKDENNQDGTDGGSPVEGKVVHPPTAGHNRQNNASSGHPASGNPGSPNPPAPDDPTTRTP